MAFDIDMTDKLAVLMDDARRLGVTMLPPCINASQADFTVERVGGALAVRYALGALKGVGTGAMQALVEERDANGPFRSLGDLVARVDPRMLNRRQVEALAGAGALDTLEPDRARVFAAAEGLLAAAAAAHDARTVGQGGLFGEATGGAPEHFPLPVAESWGASSRLAAERAAFGFYFSGHPVEAHAALLRSKKVITWNEACARPAPAGGGRVNVVMAGLIEATRWRTPNGAGADRRYLLLDMTDASGAWGASAFDAEAQEAVLEAGGRPMLLQVELNWRAGEDTPRATVRGAVPLESLTRQTRVRLIVEVRDPAALAALPALLPRGGRSLVDVVVATDAGDATWRLGGDFTVGPEAVEALQRVPGIAAARVEMPEIRLVA
jgi:DNA polymerase-3 subunit alpha